MAKPDPIPGAYVITHEPSGKFYIGSSANTHVRLNAHRSRLKRGVHPSSQLQNAVTDVNDLIIETIPATSKEHAYDLEQQLLDQRVADPLCCNVAANARNPWKDGSMPEAQRDLIRQANTGLKRSPETIQRLKTSFSNRPPPRITPVEINGVEYSSIAEAARLLNLNYQTVRKRIEYATPAWTGWKLKI